MSHPESESLAWERVKALEAELVRVRKLAGASIHTLRAWGKSLRKRENLMQMEIDIVSCQEPAEACKVVRDGLAAIATALEETAENLQARLE